MLDEILNLDKASAEKLKVVLWHAVAALAVIVAAILIINVLADTMPIDGDSNTNTTTPSTPTPTPEPTPEGWINAPEGRWGEPTSPNAIRL